MTPMPKPTCPEAFPECPVTKHISARDLPTDLSLSERFEAEQNHKAFVAVVNMLWVHRRHGRSARDFVWGLIQSNDETKKEEQKEMFDNDPQNFGDIPWQYKVDRIVAKTRLTHTDMGKITAFNAAQLNEMWSWMHMWSLGCKLLEGCRNKVVMGKMLDERWNSCGRRGEGLEMREPFISAEGKLAWGTIGEFGCEMDKVDDKDKYMLKTLIHRSTNVKTTVGDDFFIDSTFDIARNMYPDKARFESGPRKYLCVEFFPKNSPVHSWKFWTSKSAAMKTMAQLHLDTHQANLKSIQGGTSSSSQDDKNLEEYKKVLEDKRKESTKRARDTLAAARAAQNTKRRISLCSASVGAATVAKAKEAS